MAMDERYGKATGLRLVFKTFEVTVVSEIVRLTELLESVLGTLELPGTIHRTNDLLNRLLVFLIDSISYAERSG